MKIQNQQDDVKGNIKGDAQKGRTDDENAPRKSPFRSGQSADLQQEVSKSDKRAEGKPQMQARNQNSASNAQGKQPTKA